MIHDSTRLHEVIEEISQWTLQQRRQYLVDMERAFGPAAAQQLKDALQTQWTKRQSTKVR
jgi:hypothetical protein